MNSIHLKTLKVAPPGGWNYTQPESGYPMTAINFQTLLKKIAQHRYNMGYPTEGSLEDEIEADICSRLSPADQIAWCDTGISPRARVHWTDVQSFLQTTGKAWAKSGLELVPQEEAERRAAICVSCPLNVAMSGCHVCKVTLAGLRAAVLQRNTSQDDKLQACGVCKCDNKTQVHVPLDILAKGEPHTYPDFCWKAQLTKASK